MTLTCCPSISMFGKLKEFQGISYLFMVFAIRLTFQEYFKGDGQQTQILAAWSNFASAFPTCPVVCVLA